MSVQLAVPVELADLRQWVCWKFEYVDRNRTKVPYSASGRRASTTDPVTWATLNEAENAQLRIGADGVGFVFHDSSDLIGVDFDHVRDSATGEIKPYALDAIRRLSSYTEISPSGEGFHVLLRGRKPNSRCNIRFDARTREGFEIYANARYFTVTGQHFAGTPFAVRPVCDDVLAGIVADMEAKRDLGKPKQIVIVANTSQSVSRATLLDDSELLRRMFDAKNGGNVARLYHGDWSAYPSQSEADLYLCGRLAFWTGKDPAQMDRLFRGSGLMREKWDSRRGDSTVGGITIQKACEACRETFSANVTAGNISRASRSVRLQSRQSIRAVLAQEITRVRERRGNEIGFLPPLELAQVNEARAIVNRLLGTTLAPLTRLDSERERA